jgi:hypothetical protein
VHENIFYTLRNDLSISDGDKEVLTIELVLEKTKNIILSCCYRPPDGASENLSMFLQHIVKTSDAEEKKKFCVRGL